MRAPTPKGSLLVVLTFIIVLGTAFAPAMLHAEDVQLTLLTSQQDAPYTDIIKGFRQSVTQTGFTISFDEHSVRNDSTKASQIIREAQHKNTRLLFAVGTIAIQAALKEGGETPVIAALAPSEDELKRATNATGVMIDLPLEVQLQWLQKFLPARKTIGVLFNPHKTRDKIEAATKVGTAIGLRLQPRPVEGQQTLTEALSGLANESQVLWGIADQSIFSPQTAEDILLFSFRNRIPLVGLSTSWVKAGALYALDRDYVDLGVQCGEMAHKVLQGTRASALAPQAPRKVTYALNLKTASHMKIDFAQPLIDGAQQVFK